MFALESVVVVALMLLSDAEGWFFDDYKGRDLDGSLRCYQCDTTSKLPEDKDSAVICSLQNWKHANVSEKRSMIMQCPRRKSAFCHLVVREEDPLYAVRGCHGPTYDAGAVTEAHAGCFYMDHPPPTRRACLCDSMLCNGQRTSHQRLLPYHWALVSLTHIVIMLTTQINCLE